MTAITVVIADDHAVIRDGLRALLDAAAGIEVVATAADGREAIEAVHTHHPQVVLMDLAMPRMDGVQATQCVTKLAQPPLVIVLTMSDDDTSVIAAVRAGARGYLLKDAYGDDVIAAIHAVAAGHSIFGPGVASAVLQLLQNPPAHREPPFPQLSNRERDVLALVADGLGNHAIRMRLQISGKTVANTVSTMLVKLGVADREHAATRAREAGLGQPTRPP